MSKNKTYALTEEEKRKKGINLLDKWLKEIEDPETYSKEEEKSKSQENKNYNSWESLPDTLTALHISEYLHISRRRVYELFQLHENDGGIPNFEIGASKRVDKNDFQNWISKKKSK